MRTKGNQLDTAQYTTETNQIKMPQTRSATNEEEGGHLEKQNKTGRNQTRGNMRKSHNWPIVPQTNTRLWKMLEMVL